MSEIKTTHLPVRIWIDRTGFGFSYQCDCGETMRNQNFGDWPECLTAAGEAHS